MSDKDVINFYEGDKLVAIVESSMVPCLGARISIHQKIWEVVHITYSLDHSIFSGRANMCANISLKPVQQ